MSTVPQVETATTEITNTSPVSTEDTFYPVETQTEAQTATAAAPVKDAAAAEPQTVKPETKPAETADEIAFKAKTGKRFQELLDRNKQLETELAHARQPKTEDPGALKAPVEPNPDTFTG